MEVLQTRVPKETINNIDYLVKQGNFSSRSDVVRHAIRMLVFQNVPKVNIKGDPVKLVREVRDEFNKINDKLSFEEYKKFIHEKSGRIAKRS